MIGCLVFSILLLITGKSTHAMKDPANLTSITWAHAVNSQAELDDQLRSAVMMIEGDILMGTLTTDPPSLVPKILPIMAHPPSNSSDISVESFLQQIFDFNAQNPEQVKGIKLDFKEFQPVWPTIENLKMKFWKNEIWLKADIVQGPVESTDEPVDPRLFFAACRQFPTATLSIGWTTTWGGDYTVGEYTQEQTNTMKEVIVDNKVPEARSPISFPVRAGIAAHSKFVLMDLMSTFNESNFMTLTIWSSEGDTVDVDKLRDLIFSVGLDKVYLDVPADLAAQLRLNEEPINGALSVYKLTMWLPFLLTLLSVVL